MQPLPPEVGDFLTSWLTHTFTIPLVVVYLFDVVQAWRRPGAQAETGVHPLWFAIKK